MFDPKFFFYALKQIPLGSKGYARHYGLLKEKVIAYPRKIDEQANVVGLLDSMSEDVFRLDALYKQKLAAIAELKQSILQRAFSGQLTSSDMIPA
jgi:type I restriction enzyme S subunit